MFSVNTNQGAMIALQNLGKTNQGLSQAQTRINTGLAVASAKDNGGIFAIAQKMRADVSAYGVVQQSLDRGIATVDVALAAGEAISDLLIQMKEKALAASDTSLDTQSRAALNEDFVALRNQITTIVNNAEFNGANMLTSGGTNVVALANAKGTNTITVNAELMALGATGSVITLGAAATITSVALATAAVTAIDTSLNNVGQALARLGTGAKALEVHSTFVTKLSDTLEVGIGNLVDADLARESARLQSLQVKQQLGIQALAIANAAPGVLLGLFR